jgi:CO/xanthine dehydrogenase FAD-binding subunit
MIKFRELVQPESVEEAYELNLKKGNVVIGGMLWLKMQDRTCLKAIDLSLLGLDHIEETEDGFLIGAMCTLWQLEHDKALNDWFDNAFQIAFSPIVGVQFQSMATAGGSVFGRYGFGDVLTLLSALDAKVILHHQKEVEIQEFAWQKPERDILTHIFIPKKKGFTYYRAIRNQATDFPVITCAIFMEENGERAKAAFGARPGRARTVDLDLKDHSLEECAVYCKEKIPAASNLRASKEYRSRMIELLALRGLKDLADRKERTEKEEKEKEVC